jgi:hypothetical protein
LQREYRQNLPARSIDTKETKFLTPSHVNLAVEAARRRTERARQAAEESLLPLNQEAKQ